MTKRALLTKPAQCSHGYSERLRSCLICHHEPGECDWGACHVPGDDYERRATTGKLIEVRTLCDYHKHVVSQLDGQLTARSK